MTKGFSVANNNNRRGPTEAEKILELEFQDFEGLPGVKVGHPILARLMGGPDRAGFEIVVSNLGDATLTHEKAAVAMSEAMLKGDLTGVLAALRLLAARATGVSALPDKSRGRRPYEWQCQLKDLRMLASEQGSCWHRSIPGLEPAIGEGAHRKLDS